VIIDQNSRSSRTLFEFPNAMALPNLRTRNEVRFEFGYIGFATSNDARGDSGHSAFIQNIDRELY